VTLGSLADAAVTAAQKSSNQNGPLAEDEALPQLFATTPDGELVLPLKVIPSAAEPCAVPTGPVPTATACPAGTTPSGTFNGTESMYNSGWLAAGAPFSVKLSASIKPGSYRFMCLLHREEMTGTIVVVDKSQPAPSHDQQAATGQAELVTATASLQPAIAPLSKGKNPDLNFLPSGPKIVLAGSGVDASPHEVDAFGPVEVTATVGSTISWIVIGPHTISFNAPTDAQGVHQPGTNQINEKAITPVGGAGQTSFPNPPSGNGPPPGPAYINGGSFDGNGFHSSGVIISFPPALNGYKVTFTAKGTFPYKCLIHDGMKGVVTIQ
jgi:plastocyanin